MVAAAQGHRHAAQLLIRYRSDLNHKDNLGMTALMYACAAQNVDMVNFLVGGPNNPNIMLDLANLSHGSTALIIAIRKKNADIVQLLIESGASLDI